MAVWHSGVARAEEGAKLPEPQYIGTVYWFDAANVKLAGLDRQKYSESPVKISPTEEFKPGEYGVRIAGSLEVFCFGIDPR